jgi:hypothetical protein
MDVKIKIKKPLRFGTRSHFNLLTETDEPVILQTPLSILGSVWTASTPGCPGQSLIMEFVLDCEFAEELYALAHGVISRAKKSHPDLFDAKVFHENFTDSWVKLRGGPLTLSVFRQDGRTVNIESLTKGSKVICMFSMDSIWTAPNFYGIDLVAISIMDLSVTCMPDYVKLQQMMAMGAPFKLATTPSIFNPKPLPPLPPKPPPLPPPPPPPPPPPKPLHNHPQQAMVPTLADILGAKNKLKAVVVAKAPAPEGPRTVLDDIKQGAFVLRKCS